MSRKRSHKDFINALVQLATQHKYKVHNIGMSIPPREYVTGRSQDALVEVDADRFIIEISLQDMKVDGDE